jgi:hypothetical protein
MFNLYKGLKYNNIKGVRGSTYIVGRFNRFTSYYSNIYIKYKL